MHNSNGNIGRQARAEIFVREKFGIFLVSLNFRTHYFLHFYKGNREARYSRGLHRTPFDSSFEIATLRERVTTRCATSASLQWRHPLAHSLEHMVQFISN
jgi:hypothetical protein